MSKYSFRRLAVCEKGEVIDFLNEFWGLNHPLVNKDIFFDHYYLDGDMINFCGAFFGERLVAVCGYIKSTEDISDIWISIWCADPSAKGAGFELMAECAKIAGAEVVSCNNIREEVVPIYRFLGNFAEKLSRGYMINRSLEPIISKPDKEHVNSAKIGDKRLCEIDGDRLLETQIPKEQRPQKDGWYLKRRYIDYPHIKYRFFKEQSSVLIVREMICEGVKIFRIVDFLGEEKHFSAMGEGIYNLLLDENAEYIDIYYYGLSDKAVRDCGFTIFAEDDRSIIPNYLEPLKRENTDYYFFTSQTENFRMFKADGDQDRPNIF